MKSLRTLGRWWKRALDLFENFLVPEETRIKSLLALHPSSLRSLLPSSPVASPDLFVLFDYGNSAVRLLVKTVKYKNNQNIRRRLATYLFEDFLEISAETALFAGEPPLLVPMPMSKNEKRKKGFNQCEELVREIQKISGPDTRISYDSLKKIRETERQTTLSREARLRNVQNSMSADKRLVKSQTVVVLDDVYTTLASFSEARRALLESGAKRVLGLFLAH